MNREFTGRHMAAIVISGFAIVIAINLYMATLAVRGFGGVVVPNSYVASQKFNGWLDEAERQKALGWSAAVSRAKDGRLVLNAHGIPRDASVVGIAQRPLGKRETTSLRFREVSAGHYVSLAPMAPGRWIVRLTITSGGRTWVARQHLP